MAMPEKRTAWLMSVGAALMLIAGCFNLLFHGTSSIFHLRSQASVASDDSDENDSCADTTELAMAMTAWRQTQQRGTRVALAADADATGTQTQAAPAGGDIAPARSVADAYPSLHSVAVDPDANQVAVSDSNRGAIFFYNRSAGGN